MENKIRKLAGELKRALDAFEETTEEREFVAHAAQAKWKMESELRRQMRESIEAGNVPLLIVDADLWKLDPFQQLQNEYGVVAERALESLCYGSSPVLYRLHLIGLDQGSGSPRYLFVLSQGRDANNNIAQDGAKQPLSNLDLGLYDSDTSRLEDAFRKYLSGVGREDYQVAPLSIQRFSQLWAREATPTSETTG